MKSCGNCNVIDDMDTQSQIQLASFAGSIQGSLWPISIRSHHRSIVVARVHSLNEAFNKFLFFSLHLITNYNVNIINYTV